MSARSRMAVALALAAGLATAPACTARAPQPPASPGSSPSAASTPQKPRPLGTLVPVHVRSERVGSKYIFVTEQKKNRKVYVLRADEQFGQYTGPDTGRSDFTNPHITFYGNGGRTMVADAPRGTVLEKDKSVVMSGGVHARSDDGKTLTCDTLRYDDAAEMLHGEGNVVITSPGGEELRGEVLDADLHLSTMHLTGARP